MVILYGVVAVVAAFLGYVATRPASFRVERRARINATPDRIYPHLSDFHRWTSWSPWENIDPALNRTYSGPASGPGAVYEWRGNRQVGEGRMEITDASAPSDLTIKLDFLKPFEAHNTAEFTAQPQGETTTVTWAMYGPSPYFAKVMQTVISMDRMVGRDFEAGLQSLKTVAEK